MRKLVLFTPLLLSGCSLVRKVGKALVRLSGGECSDNAVLPPADPGMAVLGHCWWLIPGAILGVTAAAALVTLGRMKAAITVGVASGVCLALSVSVFANFRLIGWIGLSIPIAALGYAGYSIWIEHKGKKEVEDVVIPELVQTTEAAKAEMTEDQKINVFGTDNDHGVAGVIQSAKTEQVVAKIRGKV